MRRLALALAADTETFVIGANGYAPMPVGDFVAHMDAVQPHVDGYWSFSYDRYQSPLSGFGGAGHQAYLAYLAAGWPRRPPRGVARR